ncbi:hypothetical protein SAMN05216249_101176 [Acetitomaculum ruminis DSM 5522]|uniref:Pyridoxal phosphate homeostasis protein n=1 Tax=Acetitomaculum ruminis DSM 5522 TaxID=1120918 RepID=A0A1I0V5L0_9FIRM|nr:YggS family pyridoxal phosphate-dependent enzyme [Acetitomaculum ruminis]SFA71639.1 hypothetical protein SAMN05216249_101176 [Acetitomaculum ruminis DSM 5522]
MVKENLKEVISRVEAACKRSGRKPEDVTLIAVSKTKPIEMIEEAYSAGTREFGENKPQEMKEKYEVLPKDINWHMIGTLQRNKVKYVVPRASLIHSVDSLKLAEEIDKEAKKINKVMPVLIEVNVAKEDTKAGIYTEELMSLIEDVSRLENVQIKGLMTIAPYVENQEENREIFRTLKQLSVDIAEKNIDNVIMQILSMGMTNDYEVAIEEGATMVRVGTGIFGERNYGNLS